MLTLISLVRNLALMAKSKTVTDGNYNEIVADVVKAMMSNSEFVKMITATQEVKSTASKPSKKADVKAVLEEHSIEPTESHKMAFNISKEDFKALSKDGYTMKTAIVSITKRE
tara:strand:- start:424 stop:762 length:339 start_codon:yes stop_codon:yes gene_type:complete